MLHHAPMFVPDDRNVIPTKFQISHTAGQALPTIWSLFGGSSVHAWALSAFCKETTG